MILAARGVVVTLDLQMRDADDSFTVNRSNEYDQTIRLIDRTTTIELIDDFRVDPMKRF